jgi:Mn-dependent DtxR family transcriptional regulator
MKMPLTRAEERCLQGIKDFMKREGYCPNLVELGKEIHYSTGSVTNMLSELEAKGYIERPTHGGARAMRVKGMRFVEDGQ